jgi:hypothetical protein
MSADQKPRGACEAADGLFAEWIGLGHALVMLRPERRNCLRSSNQTKASSSVEEGVAVVLCVVEAFLQQLASCAAPPGAANKAAPSRKAGRRGGVRAGRDRFAEGQSTHR